MRACVRVRLHAHACVCVCVCVNGDIENESNRQGSRHTSQIFHNACAYRKCQRAPSRQRKQTEVVIALASLPSYVPRFLWGGRSLKKEKTGVLAGFLCCLVPEVNIPESWPTKWPVWSKAAAGGRREIETESERDSESRHQHCGCEVKG